MDPELLDDCTRWLAGGSPEAQALRLRGLHAHLASGLAADSPLESAARILAFARPWCAARGVAEPEINLGDGMAVDYQDPGNRFGWAAFGCGLARLTRPGQTLRIEPGRAVTAYCGWYATWVLDVKPSQGKVFAVVPVDAWPHRWARAGPGRRAGYRRRAAVHAQGRAGPGCAGDRAAGGVTWWRSAWPGRTRGTSRTTAFSCTRSPASTTSEPAGPPDAETRLPPPR
jgi:hypothetical protein